MLRKVPGAFWGLALWCALLTLILYREALQLPFFFDDFLHLPYAAQTSFRELWLKPALFNYFRPLQSTFWRLAYLLAGRMNRCCCMVLTFFCTRLTVFWLGFWRIKFFLAEINRLRRGGGGRVIWLLRFSWPIPSVFRLSPG